MTDGINEIIVVNFLKMEFDNNLIQYKKAKR